MRRSKTRVVNTVNGSSTETTTKNGLVVKEVTKDVNNHTSSTVTSTGTNVNFWGFGAAILLLLSLCLFIKFDNLDNVSTFDTAVGFADIVSDFGTDFKDNVDDLIKNVNRPKVVNVAEEVAHTSASPLLGQVKKFVNDLGGDNNTYNSLRAVIVFIFKLLFQFLKFVWRTFVYIFS